MLCKSPCDMSVDILESQTPLYKVRMLAYVMVEVDTKFKKFILNYNSVLASAHYYKVKLFY